MTGQEQYAGEACCRCKTEVPGKPDIFEARKCVGFGAPSAYALIKGVGAYAGISGELRLYSVYRGTLAVLDVSGLPENGTGFYGCHIHEMPDDFRTQPAGDSGMKMACGVIRASVYV